MATLKWPTKKMSVINLNLDPKNPRLGRETLGRPPREIIQYLFDHDKAIELVQSIVARGYFPNEPLLVVKEKEGYIVLEGNRRLAALKVLREPGILEGKIYNQVERLSRQIEDPSSIHTVPVTIAPSRRATDRLIAGRHKGTPVLAWTKENRASFILEKLAEGYSNDQLRDQLGFTITDIQEARQTRAVADMARSLELPDEIKAKLENPRAKLFSTLERVFDSTIGRRYLHIEHDAEHGIKGHTSASEFKKGLQKLVEDIALGKQSSRSLNTNEDIEKYFKSWDQKDLPKKKKRNFIPADIISGKSIASMDKSTSVSLPVKKSKQVSKTVVPKDLKVRYGNARINDIKRELSKLKRDDFPNAGAVLLRVFLEVTVIDFLKRLKKFDEIVEEIEKREHRKLLFGVPTMKQLLPKIIEIAKERLPQAEAVMVEKALRYDASAPFSISELHGFVHHNDFPSARDIQQFWHRTEPLFKLMLEEAIEEKLD